MTYQTPPAPTSSCSTRQSAMRWLMRSLAILLLTASGLAGHVAEGLVAVAAPLPTQVDDDSAGDDTTESTLTWSVRPTPTDDQPDRPNFQFDLEPGSTVRDSLRVRNYGTEPLSLTVYPSDALTTATGAMDLLPASETPTDLGAWVMLDGPGNITVPAQDIVDVPFTLTVPPNATPGDHSGGIVTSYVSPADGGDQTVVVDRRLVNRVQVRVAGELDPQLTVSDVTVDYRGTANPFGTGTATVRYTVTNTGNVRLTADQTVRVSGRFGLPGREVVLEPLPELLPGNSLQYVAEVNDVWPVLRANATVSLTPTAARAGDVIDPDTAGVTVTAATWAIPWTFLFLLATVVLLPVWVLWSRRRRTRQHDRVMEQMARQTAMMTQAMQAAMGSQPIPPQESPSADGANPVSTAPATRLLNGPTPSESPTPLARVAAELAPPPAPPQFPDPPTAPTATPADAPTGGGAVTGTSTTDP